LLLINAESISTSDLIASLETNVATVQIGNMSVNRHAYDFLVVTEQTVDSVFPQEANVISFPSKKV
jgi:hypothetical protein